MRFHEQVAFEEERVLIVEAEEWVTTDKGTEIGRKEVKIVGGEKTPVNPRARVPQYASLHGASASFPFEPSVSR